MFSAHLSSIPNKIVYSKVLIMTTYIPALTLPDAVFLKPALSVLLPIGLGTAVGFSATRGLTFTSISIEHY